MAKQLIVADNMLLIVIVLASHVCDWWRCLLPGDNGRWSTKVEWLNGSTPGRYR